MAASTKVVEWLRKFAGKFANDSDVIGGVVANKNEAMSILSLLKVWSKKLEQFCKYDQEYNTASKQVGVLVK